MVQIYAFLDMEPFNPALVRNQLQEQEIVPVRRPLYGLEINEETHATIQILQSSSTANITPWREILNSSVVADSDGIPRAAGTANVIITSVRYSQKENIQLVETFADSFLYAFGSSPIYLQVQAVLLKAKNFPWRTEWLRNYSDNLRAGRTVDGAARVYMTVEDTVYEGHIISCDIVDQADTPLMSPMQFIMYLTNIIHADVGGAYSRARTVEEDRPASAPKELSTTALGTTRVSSGEYIRGGLELPADREFMFDAQGNLIFRDRNRPTTAEVVDNLFREMLKVDALISAGEEDIGDGSDLTPVQQAALTAASRRAMQAMYNNLLPFTPSLYPDAAIYLQSMLDGRDVGNVATSYPVDPMSDWG